MRWWIAWLAGFFLVLAPCSADAQKHAPEAVVLQLKWTHLFQFAGFYMAKEKGYYEAAGLEVSIREKGPGVNIVRDVLSGEATYGVSDSALVLERLRGNPVVALNAVFQHSPLVLLSLKSAGIETVTDLRGRRVMISPESAENVSVRAMLKSHDVADSEMHIIPMSFNLEDLVTGKVDAFTAYLSDQPVTLQQRGVAYSVLNPEDYGFDFYGDMLFTSEAELQAHPDRVRKFIDASLKGWRYAFEHIDETIDVIVKKYASPALSREKLRAEAKALKRISGIDSEQFGRIDMEKIRTIANTFAVSGMGAGQQKRLAGFVYEPDALAMSEAEKAFVAEHPVIRVSNEYDWPPYDYRVDALPKGYAVDYMRLLARKIGVELEFVPGGWTDLLGMLERREIDAVHLMSKTPKRETYALFSDLFVQSDRVIVTQTGEKGIHSMEDLSGKRVAAVEGWANAEMMKRNHPQIRIVYKKSAEALLDAVAYGEADAAVLDYMVANYFIKQKMLSNLKVAADVTDKDDESLYIGVRNDWPLLRGLFNKAMAQVSDGERMALNDKWLFRGRNDDAKAVRLNADEAAYLRKKRVLKTCVDPNWMPLEKLENGQYIGMGSDYLELFRQRLGIPIEVVKTATWTESVRDAKARNCDMFVFSMDTPERRTYLNITKPLVAPPLVLATRMDTWIFTDLNEITDQKIGIVSGYALADVLAKKYPHIDFVYVTSIDEGLEKVARGELFAFLDAFSVLGYRIQRDYLGELKIAGRFEDTWDLGVGVRNDEPELYTIFEKVVASIGNDERKAIENKWVSVKYEQGFDYDTFWKVLVIFVAILLAVLYRNRQLVMHQRELDAKNRELEEEKAKVNYIAFHDDLTGLPNRAGFLERLEHAIGLARRHEGRIAVLFVDLDRFKMVNDTMGHDTGDAMLKEVAKRIGTVLRDTDTLSRVGGDEFVILMETFRHPNDAAFVSEKVLDVIKKSLKIGEFELQMTASIGITIYPDDGTDRHTLIKNADSAMYLAKEDGKNNYRFYTKKLSDEVHRRLQIEHDLRNAVEKGELSLVYQPQYLLSTHRVIAAEALLRWEHGDAFIGPDEFIPIAEESGIIVPIGEWIFETACREFMRWHALGLEIETIAVNVSSVQFSHGNIVSRFKAIVDRVGIDPQAVEIEITERYIMEHTEQNQAILEELRKIGFKISVDDFGTGYSSMSYLKMLPLDTIKIDKSFIDDIPHDKNDVAISRAILALAKSLDYSVVAEGIEYQEQENFLKEHGCDVGQGYLFSRPLKPDAFVAFMQDRS